MRNDQTRFSFGISYRRRECLCFNPLCLIRFTCFKCEFVCQNVNWIEMALKKTYTNNISSMVLNLCDRATDTLSPFRIRLLMRYHWNFTKCKRNQMLQVLNWQTSIHRESDSAVLIYIVWNSIWTAMDWVVRVCFVTNCVHLLRRRFPQCTVYRWSNF